MGEASRRGTREERAAQARAISKRKLGEQRARAFNDMRNRALRSLDPGTVERFLLFWNQPVPQHWPTPLDPYVLIHNARLQVADMLPEEKELSAKWLLDNKQPLPEGITYVDGKLEGVKYAGQ